MSKPPPLQRGVTYHIFARGNNRENIFIQPDNYRYFLDLYIRHVVPIADTFAYCLLKNHFHLLVRIKTEDELQPRPQGFSKTLGVSSNTAPASRTPSQTFSNFLNAYAKAINLAHQRTGSLFQHPFGRIPVMTEEYLINLVHYIHFNPQKHGFARDFREYPYSSFHALDSDKPTHLRRAEVIQWFNGRDGFREFHAALHDDKPVRKWIGDDPA